MDNDELFIDEKDLPKVLIIGQTFTADTGGGITLTNLFKNWPKNKLAVAVESKEELDFTKSSNYYRMGFKEQAMPFPFSLFQRKTRSGTVSENITKGAINVKETKPLKAKVKGYFDNALHHTGLYLWMYGNQKISPTFMEWFNEFDPDVIYYQPNSYKSIDFALSLKRMTNKPLVAHVMDDWFTFAVKNSPFKKYWDKKFDGKMRSLFAQTQVHLSICQYMSDAYLTRYGYKFYPYHNTVDLDFWMRSHPLKIEPGQPFKLLYAGRVGYGVERALETIANVVESMGNRGIAIEFEIQTKDARHPLILALGNYKHVKIAGTIAYHKLAAKFSSVNALLIPCDFDGMGIKFIKYSMPTKVSEYMAVGTPILVIGPEDTALVNYAKQGWAKVCTSPDVSAIEKAIVELAESEQLRQNIVDRAHYLVKKNHDQKHVVSTFRNMMSYLTDKRYSGTAVPSNY